MTTAKVEIWKDCGFTEGCLECPSKTSSLSSPDYTFTGLNISRETLFSQFKVKKAYEDLYDCSYVRMTMDMNNGDDVVLYGWVDKVSCGSDTANNPMTMIDWHVDYWRTYLSKASFGSGTVTKRPQSSIDPPQEHSFITNTADGTSQSLMTTADDYAYYWAIINITTSDSGTGVTQFQTRCWPVNPNMPENRLTIQYQSTTAQCPSYYDTIIGRFDELLGLDPDAIYSAWFSPISPTAYALTSGVFTMANWKVAINESGTNTYGAFFPNPSNVGSSSTYSERSKSIAVQTNDTDTYVICDMDNEPVYQFPYGLNIVEAYYRIVNADTSAYISFRFVTDGSKLVEAGANTLTCNIPLKAIAVSSNAYSSYVYSGEKEFDRRQMQIQRTQAAVSSMTSMLGSTTNNVVMSSLGSSKSERIDNFGTENARSVSTAKTGGMSMGTAALVTSGVGLAGTAIDYWSQGITNDRLLDATCKYKATQASTLTLPSSGTDFISYGNKPTIRCLTWDSYSKNQRNNNISLYGVTVEEPMTSCQSLINAGGPLRIQNLTVTGQMPVGAKQFFRDRFAKGVRIV